MKYLKNILMWAICFLILFSACSKSLEPGLDTEKSDVIRALKEVDNLLTSVVQSEGFETISQMPGTPSQGTNKQLSRTSDNSIEDDLLAALQYVFTHPGTYTYIELGMESWEYSETPEDEIIFIFPYTDTLTQTIYMAKWRFYNMADTDSGSSLSFDVYVEDFQFVEMNFILKGAVSVVDQSLQPEISSITINGFVCDNDGVKYNFDLIMSEEGMILTIGQEGQTPLVIDLTAVLSMQFDAAPAKSGMNKVLYPQEDLDKIIAVTYGDLIYYVNPSYEEGAEIGYISYVGETVAAIIFQLNPPPPGPYVIWNDGTKVPLADYTPYLADYTASEGQY